MKLPFTFLTLLLVGMTAFMPSYGQIKEDAFNSTRKSVGGGNVSAFNQGRKSNFNDFRQKLNAEYASKTREKWGDFNAFRENLSPDRNDKPVIPVRMSEEEARRDNGGKAIGFDGVEKPIKGNRQAQPIAPVQEQPGQDTQYFTFSYLGTDLKVRIPNGQKPYINGTDENSVADAWERLSDPKYNNMVIDCTKLHNSLGFSDWAYLKMLEAFSNAWCGNGSNASTLLMSYIYSQSGYKIRLGECDGKLHLLYACQHHIYDKSYYNINGEYFYPLDGEVSRISINSAFFPKEQSLSLWVNREMQVDANPSKMRRLVSQRYPDVSATVSVNKNLLSFYDSYPSSDVGGNFMTRWAMYANTPICKEAREKLYPQLRAGISGRTQLEAVERLLNWVQTAFVYEYDDKVWGHDRAFFPDETLYYPYCDCEDRAILFTRLVRDLLGLRCILIYYPGHLASAVCFTDNISGDYLNVNGSKFIVCDPTYIGAPVGRTMPNMDNGSAKVIVL